MNKKLDKIIFIIRITGLILAVGLIIYLYMNKKEYKNIQIGDNKYKVEVVKEAKDQIKGLSDRTDMNNIDGMLFIYDKSEMQSFWMKGMRFDLDIIWINNGKVIGFEENISHQDQQTSYKSSESANMVLELETGRIKKDDLKVNDEIKF